MKCAELQLDPNCFLPLILVRPEPSCTPIESTLWEFERLELWSSGSSPNRQ
jgi:hypothetical protein